MIFSVVVNVVAAYDVVVLVTVSVVSTSIFVVASFDMTVVTIV